MLVLETVAASHVSLQLASVNCFFVFFAESCYGLQE